MTTVASGHTLRAIRLSEPLSNPQCPTRATWVIAAGAGSEVADEAVVGGAGGVGGVAGVFEGEVFIVNLSAAKAGGMMAI